MISVIMPAYNEAKHIEEAINSVLNQSYQNIEVLVVNDGSTDNTLEILNKLSLKDKRLKVYDPGKLGKNGTCNYAASKASGEWYTIFAADDIMETGIIEEWMKAVIDCDPTNEKIAVLSRIKIFSRNKEYKRYDGIEIPKNRDKVCTSGAAYMGSRKMLEEMFPIPTNYPNEDGWMALYIEFLVPRIIAVKKTCINYRIHGDNSLRKNAIFNEFNEKYHSRVVVNGEFLNTYRERLNEEQQAVLANRYQLENYRFKGELFKILFFQNCSLIERMRNVFLCNCVLYKIKLILSRFFLGHN